MLNILSNELCGGCLEWCQKRRIKCVKPCGFAHVLIDGGLFSSIKLYSTSLLLVPKMMLWLVEFLALFWEVEFCCGIAKQVRWKKSNFLVLLQNKQNWAFFAPCAKKQAQAKPDKAEGKKQVQIERQTELVRGCLESCLLASKLLR